MISQKLKRARAQGNQIYYSDGNREAAATRVYSWIWYHPEQWLTSLVLAVAALAFFVHGYARESGWRLSDYIKIEITDSNDEDDLE